MFFRRNVGTRHVQQQRRESRKMRGMGEKTAVETAGVGKGEPGVFRNSAESAFPLLTVRGCVL